MFNVNFIHVVKSAWEGEAKGKSFYIFRVRFCCVRTKKKKTEYVN